MNVADRMAEIQPFHVMELMAKAKALEAQGRSIIHMEVGEPDFRTPQPVVEAAQRFIATGQVFYTNALGLPQLREAIAGFYATRYGLGVDPARIVVTAGASGALLLALGALVNPGDEWLLTDPGYPCNRHFIRLLEGRPRAIPVDATTGFQPTPEKVGAGWTANTRGLLVASPNNPTGTMIEPSRLAELALAVRSRGGTLIVDEIYHGLTYDTDARTALEIADDIVVINSFSKYFGMTGWRLGWMVVPPGMVRDIEKLAQNLFIAPSAPAQHAALAAFQPETLAILEARRKEFRARRDLLLPGLRTLGFRIDAVPQGAFYIYAGIGDLGTDSHALASDLIERAGVAATPGLDFGANAPERHMRFAYTVAAEKLGDGLDRMARHFRI
ncbi:MAG: pyridoxal phosphate-dependent aminotransferase [Gammaproteobacteria bacterium]|nr:pyridoxal phosphate-dependent aminotransferase [Gammaproteobacteria bacterium]MBU1646931.1 pyridoxal phosphate-dependent aminotransferase [Gammaproteobacteria bacterium]MBU1972443.1 pyridoxal phosphate-dependent aminotransferase [Gammaproteobacteria bacterium]